MVGLDLPLVSLQHQYLVTEAIPEVEAHGRPLPIVRDPDVSWYLRQERAGLLLGPYEWDCKLAWEGGEPPAEFGMELFADDLDRLEPYIEDAIARVPVFGRAGITRVINGPIPYTPDGNPLLGPAYGLDDVYLACAFSFGIVQGGGAGKALAEWIIRRRAGMGPLGARPAPLHRLRHPELRARQGAGALPARVCDRLPDRGAGGGPAGQDHAALRDAARQGREVRRARRLGARDLVPGGGRAGGAALELRARRLARRGGRGVPCRARAGRRPRSRRLCQARGQWGGRRCLPRPPDLRSAAAGRTSRARLHVQPERGHPLRADDHPAGRGPLLSLQRRHGRMARPPVA